MGMVVSASASWGAAGPTTTPRALAEFADSLGKRVGELIVARTFLDYAELYLNAFTTMLAELNVREWDD